MNKKLTLCLLLALRCTAPAQTSAYTWPNVALGGAGALVTGVYTLPGANNNVWIRTDVGGVYRYNPPVGAWRSDNQGSWTSLTNSFALDYAEYFACDGFAATPANPDVVLYAGGLNHGQIGAILKSSNNGTNWHRTIVPKALMTVGTINGNGANRTAGERMAINSKNNNGKLAVYGSRLTGVWYSTDAGENWMSGGLKPTPEDLADPDYNGVQCVAFDPTTEGRVYCAIQASGAHASTDGGVFVSTTGGMSWTRMAGSSSSTQRLKVSSTGTVWCTTKYSVLRYAAGQWTSLHPDGATGQDYCGLATNPAHPNEIVVEQGAQALAQGKLWHSTDTGDHWTPILYLQKHDSTTGKGPTLHTQQTWYSHPLVGGYPYIYRFSPADLAFDPTDTGLTALRGGQWYCPDINAASFTDWYQTETGHEENVMLCLACPPKRTDSVPIFELLEGSFDDPGLGWMSSKLTDFPTDRLPSTPDTGYLKRIAYCEKTPQNMLRTGCGGKYGGSNLVVSKSNDGGASWSQIAFPPDLLPMDLAVSADANSTAAVVACHQFYTQTADGSTWDPKAAVHPFQYTYDYKPASGSVVWHNVGDNLPAGTIPTTAATTAGPLGSIAILAADRVNNSYFYYLDMSKDKTIPTRVYVSHDIGHNFSPIDTTLPKRKSQYSIKTQPGTPGSVWVSADDYLTYVTVDPTTDGVPGLYRSTNFGGTFNRVTTVTRALSFGFGIGENQSLTPALYIYGSVTGDNRLGVFYSKDLGDKWTFISDTVQVQELGDGPVFMEGSRQMPRRVFVGTQGRGIFYSVPTP